MMAQMLQDGPDLTIIDDAFGVQPFPNMGTDHNANVTEIGTSVMDHGLSYHRLDNRK